MVGRFGVVAVLVLVGCSGGGSASSTSVAPTPASTVPVATSTTAAPTTTTSTTSTSTTTTKPVSEEDLVAAAYTELVEAYGAALTAPDDPSARTRFIDAASGDLLVAGLELIDMQRELGLTLRSHPTIPHTNVVEEVTFTDGVADVIACQVNSDITIVAATGEIVDDSVETSRLVLEFEKIDGRWHGRRATLIKHFEGTTCSDWQP